MCSGRSFINMQNVGISSIGILWEVDYFGCFEYFKKYIFFEYRDCKCMLVVQLHKEGQV